MNPSARKTEASTDARTSRWIAPAALVAAWAVFFAPALFLERVFYFRDLFFFHRPLREVVVRALASGQAPFLNAGLNLGQPMLADPSYSVFYPANLLYLVLPFGTAWNLVLAGHVLFAAAGLYLLARALGAGRAQAVAGAFAFGFSGPLVSALNYYSLLLAMSWTPWIFLACMTAWRRGGAAVPLAGLALAAQALACEPTVLACTIGVVGASWVAGLVRAGERGERVVRVVRGATIAAIAGLVFAVQLVPALMWIPQTDRGAALPFRASAAWWSLHPERLAELLAPYVNGNAFAQRAAAFWGGDLSDAGYPYIPRLYVGWLPLVLAPLAWRARWGRAALALGSAGFVLALGHHLPGYEWLYRAVPPLWIMRYPEKFTLFGALGLALALALGTTAAAGARKLWIATGGAALLIATGLLALGASGVPARGLAAAQEALRGAAIGHALLIGAICVAVGLLAISPRGRRFGALLLPIVALLDVAVFTREAAPTRPAADDVREPGSLAAAIPRESWVLPLVERQSDAFFSAEGDPYRSMQAALYPYSGLRWGVRYGAADDIARTMSSASARRRAAVLEGLGRGSVEAARDAGIGALVSIAPLTGAGLVRATSVREGGVEIGLYEIVPSSAALARFERGRGSVMAREIAPHLLEVEVDAVSEGIVALAREAIPGWSATLDGVPVGIEADDLALMRIAVPAGRHELVLRYTPPGLGAGLGLSAAGLALAAVSVARALLRARVGSNRSPGL